LLQAQVTKVQGFYNVRKAQVYAYRAHITEGVINVKERGGFYNSCGKEMTENVYLLDSCGAVSGLNF
jgi:hypothetical protein